MNCSRVEPAAAHQRLQRGEDLLVGEVAGGAEEDEGGGRELAVVHFFSTWPPKPLRMADSTWFWKRSWPRDAKRSNNAAVSTWAGMPASLAACTVHRPSPESETLPPNSSSPGSAASAWAVRSSSHEVMTLPRRHSSVTSARSKSYWKCSGLRSGVVSASASRPDPPM